jgi:preprotein translocase SecF subunit
MLSIISKTKFDFLKLARPAFIVSWLIILGGIGYGVFGRGSNAVNYEFKGGVEVTFSFKEKPDQEKISATLRQAIGSEPSVQFQRNLAAGTESLVVKSELLSDPAITSEADRIERTATLVAETLIREHTGAGLAVINQELSGPSVGAEIQQSALISMLLALFGILVYVAFRYEFSFAIGAVIAVIHDVLMTTGIYFLAGYQMSSPMVAALMTIIGFSINDTIVIFYRIREDLQLGVRGSFKELINIALNQTLSRTIITSGTVFLSTLALFVFGGGGLGDFSFALLIGILSGTFSTIYIASAIVLWWHKGQRPTLGPPGQAEVSATTPVTV